MKISDSLNPHYANWIASKKWHFSSSVSFAFVLLALITAVFHLGTAFFGQPTAIVYRTVSINLFLMAAFLLYPFKKEETMLKGFRLHHLIDIAWILFIIGVQVYILRDADGFMERRGEPNLADQIIATFYIIMVCEITRRSVGVSFVLLVMFFFLHAFLADHFFWFLYGPPVPYSTLIDMLFMQEDGLFGIPVLAMADFIYLFIVFGVLLFKAGAGDYFMDLAFELTRNQVGGPAKASVLSSSLMATVSGSAGSNVAITGQFSIPLMIRSGFRPTVAGAVEAVASTGGQIMPPVMGAAAFIMSYYIGVPYLKICLAALFPAILFFFSTYLMVHFEALRRGIRLSGEDNIAISFRSLVKRIYYLIPLCIIIGMLAAGFTATMAGLYAIMATFLISLIKPETRIGPERMINLLSDALQFCVPIGAACACVGIVIGSVYTSGLGLKMGALIMSLGNQSMLLTLIMTMLVSIILGMGLPTSVVYLTLAAMVIPGLVDLGVDMMAAHMFCFYFGVISCITPPVAISSFVAAGISGSNFMKTGFMSMKIGIAAYIIPFLFVNNPGILLQGDISLMTFLQLIVCLVGISSLAISVQGYLKYELKSWERLMFGLTALLTFLGGTRFEVAGTVIFVVAVALSLATSKRQSQTNKINLEVPDAATKT